MYTVTIGDDGMFRAEYVVPPALSIPLGTSGSAVDIVKNEDGRFSANGVVITAETGTLTRSFLSIPAGSAGRVSVAEGAVEAACLAVARSIPAPPLRWIPSQLAAWRWAQHQSASCWLRRANDFDSGSSDGARSMIAAWRRTSDRHCARNSASSREYTSDHSAFQSVPISPSFRRMSALLAALS